jgi:hypothetical protein
LIPPPSGDMFAYTPKQKGVCSPIGVILMVADENAMGVAGEGEQTFENPPNKRLVRWMLILAIYAIVLGILGYIITVSLIILVGATLLGLFIYFQMWWREYRHRPSRVIVGCELAVLRYHSGKERTVSWSEVSAIHVSSMSTVPKREELVSTESALQIKGKVTAVPISRVIAQAMVQAYAQALGSPPPSFK